MKLLTLLFLTLSIPVCAQFHNVKGVRIVERTAAGDSTTISGVGQIQYDGDDDKLRFNDGNGWFSFLKDDVLYWPSTGTLELDGQTSIQVPDGFGAGMSLAIETVVGDAHSGIFFEDDGFFGPIPFFGAFNSSTGVTHSITTSNGVTMTSTDGGGSSVSFNVHDVETEGTGVRMTDNRTTKRGIEYAADGYVTGNRSLTDKGYVDGKFDGIEVPEGANKTMGIATLSSGTITVNTTAVTATSRIFLTINGGTLTNVGTPYVSARSAGNSFTITSTNGSDASNVAWLIIEPF